MIHVKSEADLIAVEVPGSIDVGGGKDNDLQLPIHDQVIVWPADARRRHGRFS